MCLLTLSQTTVLQIPGVSVGTRNIQVASVELWVSGSHGLGGISSDAICECFIGCDVYICGRRTSLFAAGEH